MLEEKGVREKLTKGAGVFLSMEVANNFGVSEAIFLSQLHYWLNHSKNERDGFTWVYKTYKEWQEELYCLSNTTIRRAISSLEEVGIIISTDRYNRFKVDRTKWYRIDYIKLDEILKKNNEKTPKVNGNKSVQNEQIEIQNGQIINIQNEQSLYQNEQSKHQKEQVIGVLNEQVSTNILNNTSLKYEQDNNSINYQHQRVSNVQEIYSAAELIFEDINNELKTGLLLAVTLCGFETVREAIYKLSQTEKEESITINDVHKLAEQIKAAS